MIETLSLQNFKILRDVEVKLQPFTLLVGPNASGKSSLLEALSCFTRCISSRSSPDNSWLQLMNSLRPLSRKPLGDLSLEGKMRHLGQELILFLGASESSLTWNGKELPVLRVPDEFKIKTSSILRLDPQRLAAPSPTQPTLNLANDGRGLAFVLAALHLEHLPRFQRLVEQLKKIVPSVLNLRVRIVPAKQDSSYELLFDMHGAEDIPAFAISDGTLLTLGLLSVLAVPEPPKLILVEDLERGLHPKALGDLVSQLRLLQAQNPDFQIIATSHSPYLLDHFKAEEILLTSLDEDGYAVVKPLTDHPEYERWKDLMAPGEFWSTVGEKWVTEGETKKTSAAGR